MAKIFKEPPPEPLPPPVGKVDRRALLEAYQEVIRTTKDKPAVRRETGPDRRPYWLTAGLLIAALSALLVFQPRWMFNRPPDEPPNLKEASLRVRMYLEIDRIERFKQAKGKLPANLPEAGGDSVGMVFEPRGSARSTLRTFAGPAFTRGFENIVYSVKTGRTGFEKAHGKPIFDYLADNPLEASMFSETMVGFHGAEPAAVAAAYDFSAFGTIVDVGGATGNMLAAILTRHPKPRAVLFDRSQVVADAPALLASAGVMERVEIAGGDFFVSVPSGGDAYILSHILHDWSEEQCLTILRNIRKSMNPDGRLLVVETVLPAGDDPHPGKLLDIVMLVIPGGEERTEAEYAPLLAKAGFRLQRVVPTESPVSIVEASVA